MILGTLAAIASTKAGLPYQWVTVGTQGSLYTSTSTTAASWTSQTSSFGTTDIYDVASDGVSQYIAVGAAAKLATSPDGITWTQRTSSFGTTAINGIAYGNGVWVAGGAGGKLATSTDGITWTQRTSSHGTTEIIRVIYANGVWVTTGVSGKVATATDPTGTWTQRTSTLASLVYLNFYSTLNSLYIAGIDTGTTGALASSPDGTTWTARNSAISLQGGSNADGTNDNAVNVLVTNNTVSAQIQTSTDGTTWTSRTSAITDPVFSVAEDGTGLFCSVHYSALDGRWRFQTSSDGTTWTDRHATAIITRVPQRICHSSALPPAR